MARAFQRDQGLLNQRLAVLARLEDHEAADHQKGRQNRGILSQLGAVLVGVITGSGELAQIAAMLDAMGIPHSPADTGQLFQSPVGMDVYSYLQVLLFPQGIASIRPDQISQGDQVGVTGIVINALAAPRPPAGGGRLLGVVARLLGRR
mgnify:CR=1 FL=1